MIYFFGKSSDVKRLSSNTLRKYISMVENQIFFQWSIQKIDFCQEIIVY
jgi:hypothetical protein